jgi:hypothetical protein
MEQRDFVIVVIGDVRAERALPPVDDSG